LVNVLLLQSWHLYLGAYILAPISWHYSRLTIGIVTVLVNHVIKSMWRAVKLLEC